MCRFSQIALFLALTVFLTSSATGSIQLNATPATATVAYEGNANFLNVRTGAAFTGPDTIIEKRFGLGVSSMVFNPVQYLASDLDFTLLGGGFRWTERIFNNTGTTWSNFTLTLTDPTGDFVPDAFFGTPSFVTIAPTIFGVGGVGSIGGAIPGSPVPPVNILFDDLPNPGSADTLGTAVLSGVNKIVTLTFNTPLVSGSFFDIHVPIQNLGTTDGEFQLTQSATFSGPVVPEAASIMVWALLCSTVTGYMWSRHRRLGPIR